MQLVSVVSFPMAVGIVVVAPAFIEGVLGPQWLPATGAMQLLAVYGLLVSLTAAFHQIWKALGRPDYIAKLGFLRVGCIALLIWPATARWGIVGTALVVVGVYLFPMLPIDVYLAADIVEGRSMQLYSEFIYPFIAATVMFGSLRYATSVMYLSPLVELTVLVPTGALLYFVVAFLLERQFDWGIERNLRMISDGLRG